MVTRACLVVLACCATHAHAENKNLVAARKAIEEVRYDEAQPLLAAALQAGGNSPNDVIELYRLSASTATVLGQPEIAEQFYRRWLALVPDATLPDTVAPKLRAPFERARAAMAGRGRIAVAVRRSGHAIDVVVESDPLAMVVGAAIEAEAPLAPKPFVARAVRFVDVDPAADVAITILDEHDNHLLSVQAPAQAATAQADSESGTPWYRNYLVWAVPAVAFGGVGVGFGIAANGAQREIDELQPDEHFASELDAAHERRDRYALIANIGFIAGGACAVTAVIMAIVRPRANVSIAAAPSATGTMFVISHRW